MALLLLLMAKLLAGMDPAARLRASIDRERGRGGAWGRAM